MLPIGQVTIIPGFPPLNLMSGPGPHQYAIANYNYNTASAAVSSLSTLFR